MSMDEELQRQSLDCLAQCHGKTHHEDEVSAQEHVRELGGGAYYYDCECPSFLTIGGEVAEGPHFHVASSSVPRRWRRLIENQETADHKEGAYYAEP